MVNGQVKGKDFERLVAKILTQKTGVKWNRVPQSGATATAQGVTDPRFKGDLFTEAPAYEKYLIECKITGRRFTLSELFTEKSVLYKWWVQAHREAKGKIPILIFRFAKSPIFIMRDWKEEDLGVETKLLPPSNGYLDLETLKGAPPVIIQKLEEEG